jgi:hypothetical protein
VSSQLSSQLPLQSPELIHNHNRRLDPIFAITIGLSAAAIRINREEKAKGFTQQQTMDTLDRRVGIAWGRVMGES